jgi:hypothetical protein
MLLRIWRTSESPRCRGDLNLSASLRLRLAIARSEEDFDEMEKLQKDIEKINREINLSKVGHS